MSIFSVRTYMSQVQSSCNYFEVFSVSGKIAPLFTALLCDVLFIFNIDLLYMYICIYLFILRLSENQYRVQYYKD